MTETWLSVTDQPVFAWAGLWRESDEWGTVYTGVMTANAPELAHIHDRSPVIIDPVDWMTWLTAPLPDLYQFDRPYPADRMIVEATEVPWFQRPVAPPTARS
ncbi:SOS response-associated peptidase family protein [Sphingobium sufflavum]|uniref:SOS response-associated peptidase family protein n=1 Tax=Sphingobium sufflavum TaxID=1129547 RepID=UPI001F35350B|nr:SOS response-associated peptidase family protein [Sphingobium sufflavum]MCE7797839.1 SOS response-associated peptidase family protein [Sphingobium sufflavum]